MRRRIDTLLPHSSFKMDEEVYTITKIDNGMVWCERENGTYVILGGHNEVDEAHERTIERLLWSYLP